MSTTNKQTESAVTANSVTQDEDTLRIDLPDNITDKQGEEAAAAIAECAASE